jgi:hypothetical protein
MKISIPKPCSENWNQMTASEKGRVCASCQTQVVNFKGMPVEEIKNFLEQETGATCGRFSTYQLEVFNATYQELPTASNLRKWTMAAVLAGVSVLPTFAQGSNPTIPAPLPNTSISYYQVETTETVSASDTVILTGRVIDLDTNEGIIGATIILPGTKIGCYTDIFGEFSLKVPKSKEAIILEVHYLGYNPLFHSIIPDSTKINLILSLNEDVLLGMIIISKKQQRSNKRAYRKELREERKRERAAKKEQKS